MALNFFIFSVKDTWSLGNTLYLSLQIQMNWTDQMYLTDKWCWCKAVKGRFATYQMLTLYMTIESPHQK